MKLVRTEVNEIRSRRVYDEALTPFERLKACQNMSPKELDRLERKISEIDPFVLQEVIEARLRKIWKLQKARERKLAA